MSKLPVDAFVKAHAAEELASRPVPQELGKSKKDARSPASEYSRPGEGFSIKPVHQKTDHMPDNPDWGNDGSAEPPSLISLQSQELNRGKVAFKNLFLLVLVLMLLLGGIISLIPSRDKRVEKA